MTADPAEEQERLILIVAGEASGDLHGASLVSALRVIDPRLTFIGIGGERLRKAGVQLVAHSSEMAVVGITEAFAKIGYLLSVRKRLQEIMASRKPALLILIDYPDFNLSLARYAKGLGLSVFYYISPQVWAWRRRRVRSIARTVDRMAVILPFEKEIYGETNLDVRFVGHPLLDSVRRTFTKIEARQAFGLDTEKLTIAILPGSRIAEVNKLLPPALEALKLLRNRLPPFQALLPLADSLDGAFVQRIVGRHGIAVTVVQNNTYDVVGASDAAIVASGTATLETALVGTPMVIIYKVSPLSYVLGRLFVRIKHIGLVNIIAGKTVAPELIQSHANASEIAENLFRIVTDDDVSATMRASFQIVASSLGKPGAARRAAALAHEMINGGGK
ncbi:MAG: lipid-A-disaccharide synthase [Deltaproteobacteria bacterium]|nr:lipid-A-disaccharide synthase [Deltaproteobacteria bacterium]